MKNSITIPAAIAAALLLYSCGPAQAQNIGTVSGSRSQASSGAAAQGGNNFNQINFPAQTGHIDYDGGYRVANVPSLAAPALSQSLTGTCFGSVSAGVGVQGFGFLGAKTYEDKECQLRYDAQTVVGSLHDRELGMAIMCLSPRVRKADETLAHPRCPAPKAKPTRIVESDSPTPSDRYTGPDWAND